MDSERNPIENGDRAYRIYRAIPARGHGATIADIADGAGEPDLKYVSSIVESHAREGEVAVSGPIHSRRYLRTI